MEIHVDMAYARRIFDEFHRENLLVMCKDMVLFQILKNGIQFEKNRKVFEPPLEVADAFEEHWEPFVKDALVSAMCLGFVVVKMVKDQTKRNIPTVVRPHHYELHYRINENLYEYWITSSVLETDDMYVYTNFGNPALPTGEIVSTVSRVLNKCRFLKELRYTTLIMEKKKSNPDYFTEVVESSNKERHEGVDFDFFADTSSDDTAADMQFERSKMNVEILMKQQELYSQYRGRYAKQVKTLESITQLPNGQHVVPTAQNTGRQDLTQTHKIIQEEICSGMGVPRSLMIGDSLYKGDTEGVTDSFKHTILNWKQALSYMCTDLYQKAYVNLKKLKVSKNVFLSKQRHQIKVVFPVHPYISTEELDYLYTRAIIPWEVYSKHALQNTSIPDYFRNTKAPSAEELQRINGILEEVDRSDKAVGNAKRKRAAR